LTGIEIASAYVSLIPSTRDWDREVQRQLKGKSVDVDVDADVSGAARDVERWRASEGRKSVGIKVDVDTGNASSQLRGMRRDIEMLGRSDALRLNLGASAITGLPMLAAGLAEVASGLQQVAQAGLAVPGALAGVTASAGTLMLGLSGIKDAYTSLGAAADSAATSGSDMAAQAKAQQSASYSLRNAIVDEAQARKDVAQATRDARRELVDLNVEMRGGVISEKRAVLEAQRAREELAKGGFKSASDVQDALLRIEEADQRVLEVRSRNAQTAEKLVDANSKGIANSDRVVAANEQLARSEQQVSMAQAALADSGPKASAAQDKAALAMSKLHPEARQLVETMHELAEGPGMDLRNLVQGNITDGLSDQLRELSTKALPTLEKGLGGIGDAWNNTFTEIMSQVGEDENLSLLDRIFGNTADAQNRMNDAIDPLIEGVGVLTAAGSDSLPRLADAFVTVSERFNSFITTADSDGRLDRWIDEGITAVGNLGETALNVGKMFTAITNSTGPSTLLEDISRITGQWQTFLNSAQGQQTLQSIWAEGREMFAQWKPILEDLPALFLGLYDAAKLYMGPLLEIVDNITSLLSDHPSLVQVAAGAYVAFKSAQVIGAVSNLTTSLTSMSTLLGTTLPDSANKGATGISAALSRVVVPAWLTYLVYSQGKSIFDNATKDDAQFPGQSTPTDPTGQRGMQNRTTGGTVMGIPSYANDRAFQSSPTPNGSSPTGSREPGWGSTPGLDGGGGNFDFNPNNEDTGGALSPINQGIQNYLRNDLGFQGDIGGYRQPDGFNEHSSGKASDVMVRSSAEGNALLPNVLRQPGVEYIIWEQKIWYPDGTSKQMEDRGSPTQNHMDHLHVKTFDQGGPWPSGTMGVNTTGKPEFVLTPEDIEYLRSQGIDPVSIQQQAIGNLPSESLKPDEQVAQWGLAQANRTQGYIPAAAGNTGKTGGGLAGSFINMGAEAVNGLIDQAASAGAMGANAFAPGAGMAIGMAADIAKHGVKYGAEMAGIGIGALTEIAMPFGAPRWLTDVDPTSFMPQTGINPIAVTTGERSAVDPLTTQHGGGVGAPPGPVAPTVPQPTVGAGALSAVAKEAANISAPPQVPPVHVENITAVDAQDVGVQIAKRQRLAAMQYGGRP
jgi:hypothetical protein